jgi:hypothetical protein
MADVTAPGSLLTAHRFPTLDAPLIHLLRWLAADNWGRQTIARDRDFVSFIDR